MLSQLVSGNLLSSYVNQFAVLVAAALQVLALGLLARWDHARFNLSACHRFGMSREQRRVSLDTIKGADIGVWVGPMSLVLDSSFSYNRSRAYDHASPRSWPGNCTTQVPDDTTAGLAAGRPGIPHCLWTVPVCSAVAAHPKLPTNEALRTNGGFAQCSVA